MIFFRRSADQDDAPKPEQLRVFAPDLPIVDPAQDRFKRHPFAQRIAKTIAQRSDPSSIVVLIHGVWGEGKTSVLEFIDKELQTLPNVVPVRFNPWRFTDEATLLLTFFNTIATALDKPTKTTKEKIGDAFRKYGEVAGELAIDLHGTKLSSGKAIPKIGEILSLIPLEEKRERIERLLREAGIRVVVFIDDIDRLDRKEAQAVFKLLKLTANFTNVSYILAFDRNVVAKAISEQYGAGDHRAGYDYLEKIIQVNLNLPLADHEALTTLCLDLLQQAVADAGITLSAAQEKEFQLTFIQAIAPDLTTPRVAKLYANAVAFALPLLAGEINPVDLLLLEALKVFHPLLHEHLRTSPPLYTGQFGWDLTKAIEGGKQSQAAIQAQLNEIPAQRRDHAHHLLTELFPQLHDLLRSGKYGSTNPERARREQRVADGDYLKRYLSCSIPAGDIADQDIKDYLKASASMTDAAADTAYTALLQKGEILTTLLKLNAHLEEAPIDAGMAVCRAIARNGALLPDPPGDWSRVSNTAGLVIRDVARRLPQPQRRELLQAVLTDAQPLAFAKTCFDWMQLQRNEHETQRIVSLNEEQDLRAILAQRIGSYAAITSLVVGRPDTFIPLLRVWGDVAGREPVQAHVGAVLKAAPDMAEVLLAPFANFDRTAFTQEGYEVLTQLVVPEDLLAILEARGLLDVGRTDAIAHLAQSFEVLHAAQSPHLTVPPATEVP